MAKPRVNSKIKKAPPHEFVLEALARVDFHTKPMFGALAVYVGERIVLILRDSESHRDDNGVWVVAEREEHAGLRRELPSMRDIRLFSDGGPTTWQNIPAEDERFEEDSLRACELIVRGDPRVGRVPLSRSRKRAKRPAKT